MGVSRECRTGSVGVWVTRVTSSAWLCSSCWSLWLASFGTGAVLSEVGLHSIPDHAPSGPAVCLMRSYGGILVVTGEHRTGIVEVSDQGTRVMSRCNIGQREFCCYDFFASVISLRGRQVAERVAVVGQHAGLRTCRQAWGSAQYRHARCRSSPVDVLLCSPKLSAVVWRVSGPGGRTGDDIDDEKCMFSMGEQRSLSTVSSLALPGGR